MDTGQIPLPLIVIQGVATNVGTTWTPTVIFFDVILAMFLSPPWEDAEVFYYYCIQSIKLEKTHT